MGHLESFLTESILKFSDAFRAETTAVDIAKAPFAAHKITGAAMKIVE
jgi:hypothetical protein